MQSAKRKLKTKVMRKIIFFLACAISLIANDIVIKESKYGVSQTIQNIKEIVAKKGFGVFAIINHKGNAGMVGMEMQEAKVILFGNPKAGTVLMQENILSGLDLPLRVLVYRDTPSSVKVAYRDITTLAKTHQMDKNQALYQMMDAGLENIVNEAIR